MTELEAALARIVVLEQIDDRGYPTANLADAVEIARAALRAKENSDPAIWKAAHKGCLARAIPPTPLAVQPLSREEMMQMWEEAERYPFVDSALAFGEAIQRHFMGGES